MNAGIFRHKIGGGVAVARRAGAMNAIDTINHFFLNKAYHPVARVNPLNHAQCVKVHHSDGWTEEIPVNQIDSITFSDTTTHLAPTVMLNNGMTLPTLGIGTYSLHGDVCFNSVYTALKNDPVAVV